MYQTSFKGRESLQYPPSAGMGFRLNKSFQNQISNLIFVQLAVLVCGLSLVLEGDNNETHEDVDHEEGNDDDVDEVEHGHDGAVVVQRAPVLLIRIDRHIQNTEI